MAAAEEEDAAALDDDMDASTELANVVSVCVANDVKTHEFLSSLHVAFYFRALERTTHAWR